MLNILQGGIVSLLAHICHGCRFERRMLALQYRGRDPLIKQSVGLFAQIVTVADILAFLSLFHEIFELLIVENKFLLVMSVQLLGIIGRITFIFEFLLAFWN